LLLLIIQETALFKNHSSSNTDSVVEKLEQIVNSAKKLKQEVAIYDYAIAA